MAHEFSSPTSSVPYFTIRIGKRPELAPVTLAAFRRVYNRNRVHAILEGDGLARLLTAESEYRTRLDAQLELDADDWRYVGDEL